MIYVSVLYNLEKVLIFSIWIGSNSIAGPVEISVEYIWNNASANK